MNTETSHGPGPARDQFDRAKDAAERVARLTADPEPENGMWRLYLATAMAELDLALYRAMPGQEKITHTAKLIS